jgi:hypothetical protein
VFWRRDCDQRRGARIHVEPAKVGDTMFGYDRVGIAPLNRHEARIVKARNDP